MTIGDIRAAVGVVRCVRDDWPAHLVEGEIARLAEEYTKSDVLYAITRIADDPSNRAPLMLTLKAPEIIEKLHAKTAGPRTPGPEVLNKMSNCFICMKRRDVCQQSAGNRGSNKDHDFVSFADGEASLPPGRRRLALPRLRDIDDSP